MNAHIEHQIIYNGDEPVFAVIPYTEYLLKFAKPVSEHGEGEVPGEVIHKIFLDKKKPARAWREHLGKTQTEVAKAMGITQGAYSQMEKVDNPQKETLFKVAKALGIEADLLDL